MTRAGNEILAEFNEILKTASKEDKPNKTLELIQKMAETATSLDESGDVEAASAVDDALRIIMNNIDGKSANKEVKEVKKEAALVDEGSLLAIYDRIESIEKAVNHFRMRIEAIETKLSMTPELVGG